MSTLAPQPSTPVVVPAAAVLCGVLAAAASLPWAAVAAAAVVGAATAAGITALAHRRPQATSATTASRAVAVPAGDAPEWLVVTMMATHVEAVLEVPSGLSVQLADSPAIVDVYRGGQRVERIHDTKLGAVDGAVPAVRQVFFAAPMVDEQLRRCLTRWELMPLSATVTVDVRGGVQRFRSAVLTDDLWAVTVDAT